MPDRFREIMSNPDMYYQGWKHRTFTHRPRKFPEVPSSVVPGVNVSDRHGGVHHVSGVQAGGLAQALVPTASHP